MSSDKYLDRRVDFEEILASIEQLDAQRVSLRHKVARYAEYGARENIFTDARWLASSVSMLREHCVQIAHRPELHPLISSAAFLLDWNAERFCELVDRKQTQGAMVSIDSLSDSIAAFRRAVAQTVGALELSRSAE